MKRFYIVSVIATLALLAGCIRTTDENATVEAAKSELSIGLPSSISRTAVDDEGRATWIPGDSFALWAEAADGGYALEALRFRMMYYWHSRQSAVFTSITNGIAEGDYTYYAVAPMPTSYSGKVATFNIPTEQEGTTFNGTYDVMVAAPLFAEAVELEKVNNFALDFNHKMHALKVNIAENNLGCAISQLRFAFATNVTGNVSVDITDPSAEATLADGSKNLHINTSAGIDQGATAWGAIFPQEVSDEITFTAIGVDGRESCTKTISLSKICREGHITPLALTVPAMKATIRFIVANNYLGEKIQTMTITDHTGANIVFPYNEKNIYDYTVNTSDPAVFDHYEGKTFTATFESANAIVSTTFTMPSELGAGMNVAPTLNVPYLFFEDFSCIHTAGEKNGDNDVAASEREQAGASLDSYMDHKGWNAARFMLGVGTCPRINARYQQVGVTWPVKYEFLSTHHGRLDTPAISNLKDGAKVKIRLQFDAGGVEYRGNYTNEEALTVSVTSHESTASVINGIPTGATGLSSTYDTTIADFGAKLFTTVLTASYNTSSFGSTFPTHTTQITDVTKKTRFCFFPESTFTMSGITNNEVAFYIDNIRISIVSDEDE